MEQRQPLLLISLWVLLLTLLLASGDVPVTFLQWGSSVCSLGAILGLVRGKNSMAMWLGCLAIGCCTSGQLVERSVSSGIDFGPKLRARIEGRVVNVRRCTPTVRKYVIDGEVDAALLPCVLTRCIINEGVRDSTIPLPRVGEYRIVFAEIHRPDPATLPSEFPEVALCRSVCASFIAERARSVVTHEQPWLYRSRDIVRNWITATLSHYLPRNEAWIAVAVVIGDKSGLEFTSMQAYAASGTAHMFSVSGSHVGVILGVLFLLIGRSPSWWRVVVISLFIAVYVFVSGAEPPAIRAGMMGIVALIIKRGERDVDLVNILCGVVILMICFDPISLLQPGMVLSVIAMASILIVAPLWFQRIMQLVHRPRPWKVAIVMTLATSIAATIGVSIPSIAYFSSTSLTAPIVNLVVVPLLSVALVLSLVVCAVSAVGIAYPIAWCATVVIKAADALAIAGADHSLDSVPITLRWIVVVLFIIVLLWPTVAKSMLGALVRVACGITVVILLIWNTSSEDPYHVVAQRREGVVIAYRYRDTMNVLLRGQLYTGSDVRLHQWCAQQRIPLACEGVGLWGRRMSGGIRSKLVGSIYEDSRRSRR